MENPWELEPSQAVIQFFHPWFLQIKKTSSTHYSSYSNAKRKIQKFPKSNPKIVINIESLLRYLFLVMVWRNLQNLWRKSSQTSHGFRFTMIPPWHSSLRYSYIASACSEMMRFTTEGLFFGARGFGRHHWGRCRWWKIMKDNEMGMYADASMFGKIGFSMVSHLLCVCLPIPPTRERTWGTIWPIYGDVVAKDHITIVGIYPPVN